MVTISAEQEWPDMAQIRHGAGETEEAGQSNQSRPPVHPIPLLQGPFEESIVESNNRSEDDGLLALDAPSRRDLVLKSEEYVRICGGSWRQMSGERQAAGFLPDRERRGRLIKHIFRYHPLWKLAAQISFGMHLLAKGLAKSDLDVMRILQRHVDELDTFLEKTTEDFLVAHRDILERLGYLRLPLGNLGTFDEMLGDPAFRQSVVEDNERLQFIVERSVAAMRDGLKDTGKGIEAVNTLRQYLGELGSQWPDRPANLDAVYQVMTGNIEAWEVAFARLQREGHDLSTALDELGNAITEVQRRIGMAEKVRRSQVEASHILTLNRLHAPKPEVPDGRVPNR
jgi:hypothetical protein